MKAQTTIYFTARMAWKPIAEILLMANMFMGLTIPDTEAFLSAHCQTPNSEIQGIFEVAIESEEKVKEAIALAKKA